MMDAGFGFNGFDNFMFTAVPVIVVIGFIIVFGTIIIRAFRGGMQWNRNNNSPVLTVTAKVIAKRTEINRYSHHSDNSSTSLDSTSLTKHYATFAVESGDRMEFSIPGKEYGLLVEGDDGRLTFQGTRYMGFDRWK